VSGPEETPEPATPERLGIRTDDRDEARVLVVSGAVDNVTVTQFRHAISVALESLESRPLIVDLSALQFLGSAGLVETATALSGKTENLGLRVVVDHTRQVIRSIQVSGLDAMLAIYNRVEDALDR
jgi:anti-anti-sigma factor